MWIFFMKIMYTFIKHGFPALHLEYRINFYHIRKYIRELGNCG